MSERISRFLFVAGMVLSTGVLAAPARVAITLTGCGARGGFVYFGNGGGYQLPVYDCAASISGHGILRADQVNCWAEAEPGTLLSIRAYQFSHQHSYQAPGGEYRSWLVNFVGFSGQCSGFGEKLSSPSVYACNFAMPRDGTFLNLRFQSNPSFPAPPMEGPVCNPAPPPVGGPNGGGVDGAALVGALGNAGADIINRLKLGFLLQATAVSMNLPTTNADGVVNFTVAYQPPAPAPAPQANEAFISEPAAAVAPPVIVSRGRAVVTPHQPLLVELQSTPDGRAALRGKQRARLYVIASFRARGAAERFRWRSRRFVLTR
ncbi:hypothetical protein ACW73L_17250 [Methylolobus aquaticus]